MPVDQWVDFIVVDQSDVIVRSCGDPKKIWVVRVEDIVAVKLDTLHTLRVKK